MKWQYWQMPGCTCRSSSMQILISLRNAGLPRTGLQWRLDYRGDCRNHFQIAALNHFYFCLTFLGGGWGFIVERFNKWIILWKHCFVCRRSTEELHPIIWGKWWWAASMPCKLIEGWGIHGSVQSCEMKELLVIQNCFSGVNYLNQGHLQAEVVA